MHQSDRVTASARREGPASQVFVVEIWRCTPAAPEFRASARAVESAERQWFADADALARFFASHAA